jgi:hypothetical protein
MAAASKRKKTGQHCRAGFDLRTEAYKLYGVDVTHQTLLGAYLRRIQAKLGPAAATTATAHKIAVIFYTIVKKQVECDETVWAAHAAVRETRFRARLQRQAKQLGNTLTSSTTTLLLDRGSSSRGLYRTPIAA